MLNAAVIGLGWRGRTISGRMQASQEMRIMRAVNLFPEKQGDYTAKYGVPVTGDYTAVLAGPDIGAVILNTPNNLHTAQIVQVAHAGKHVVCEKPVALKVADARRSRSAVTRADPRHESRTPL
ncbi:MAG: Gfo/Idh/MocA family oxidoreductase [Candidatus Saccharibacteria bacterium]|nr:Gfo/Idh/MocA family oxidoreductase [Pseudorhodobacter sp.]